MGKIMTIRNKWFIKMLMREIVDDAWEIAKLREDSEDAEIDYG